MDGDGSNPLRDTGVKAFQINVWAREEKLDSFALPREQRIDCLKQVITDLTLQWVTQIRFMKRKGTSL